MADSGEKTKMKWGKASEEMVQTFMKAVQFLPGVQVRKMFGYPCAFFQGQMFAGLFENSMFLRLSSADREEFKARVGGRSFEPMPGKPMREYAVIPADVLANEELLDAWLERSFKYAAALPPKAPRQKK
jgi:TfoX/Sxy family transcriptional regulator of competence genes